MTQPGQGLGEDSATSEPSWGFPCGFGSRYIVLSSHLAGLLL